MPALVSPSEDDSVIPVLEAALWLPPGVERTLVGIAERFLGENEIANELGIGTSLNVKSVLFTKCPIVAGTRGDVLYANALVKSSQGNPAHLEVEQPLYDVALFLEGVGGEGFKTGLVSDVVLDILRDKIKFVDANGAFHSLNILAAEVEALKNLQDGGLWHEELLGNLIGGQDNSGEGAQRAIFEVDDLQVVLWPQLPLLRENLFYIYISIEGVRHRTAFPLYPNLKVRVGPELGPVLPVTPQRLAEDEGVVRLFSYHVGNFLGAGYDSHYCTFSYN